MEIARSSLDYPNKDVREDRSTKPRSTAAERLRELLAEENSIVVCPGVYDGLTARIALQAGFDCLYMVSFSDTFPVNILPAILEAKRIS